MLHVQRSRETLAGAMARPPTTLESLAAALAPEARERLAAIQGDARARAALLGAPPSRSPAEGPSVPRRGPPCAVSVSRRGAVLVVSLKGLRLVSAPNTREHWTGRAERARGDRAVVASALDGVPPPPGPWTVTITRAGPKLLDTDNLAGAAKALRDAVATWLGVDDGPAAPVRWEYGQTRGGYGATLVVVGAGGG